MEGESEVSQFEENSGFSQHKSKKKKHRKNHGESQYENSELQLQSGENLLSELKRKKKKRKVDLGDDDNQTERDTFQLPHENSFILPQHKSKKKKHKKHQCDNEREEDESKFLSEENLKLSKHVSHLKTNSETDNEVQFQYEENLEFAQQAINTDKPKSSYDGEKPEGVYLQLPYDENLKSSKHKSKKKKHQKHDNVEKDEIEFHDVGSFEHSSEVKKKSKKTKHYNKSEESEAQIQPDDNLTFSEYKTHRKKHKKDKNNEIIVECEENSVIPSMPVKRKESKRDDDGILNAEWEHQSTEILEHTQEIFKKKKHKKNNDKKELMDAESEFHHTSPQLKTNTINESEMPSKKKKNKAKKNERIDSLTNDKEQNLDNDFVKTYECESMGPLPYLDHDECNSVVHRIHDNEMEEIHSNNQTKKSKKHKKSKTEAWSLNDNALEMHLEVDATQRKSKKQKDSKPPKCEFDSEQLLVSDASSLANSSHAQLDEDLVQTKEYCNDNSNVESLPKAKKKVKKSKSLSIGLSDCVDDNQNFEALALEKDLTSKNEKMSGSNSTSTKKKCKKKRKHNIDLETQNSCHSMRDADELNLDKSFQHDSPVIKKKKLHHLEEAFQNNKKQVQRENSGFANDWSSVCRDLDDVEEFPNFDIPPLHQNERVRPMTKEEKSKYIEEGIEIKTGKFSKEENAIFKRNWENFIQKYNINEPASMLGINCGGVRRKKLMKFLKAKHFYVQLAKDLNNRPLYAIYKHARAVLDPSKNANKLTPKEVDKLMFLYSVHGRRWSKIAGLMGKTAGQCLESFRVHKSKQHNGRWTEKEKLSLKDAVTTVCGTEKKLRRLLRKPCGTSWDKISNLVKTRNSSQCREQWMQKMASKTKRRKWGRESRLLLTYVLYKNLVEDETLINWESIYPMFRHCVHSYAALIVRWGKIRRTVPDYKHKTHPQIMTYLFQNYIPKLLKKCSLTFDDLEKRAKT